MSITDAIKGRISRVIGLALIEISWDKPENAAKFLEEAAYHLHGLAERDKPKPDTITG